MASHRQAASAASQTPSQQPDPQAIGRARVVQRHLIREQEYEIRVITTSMPDNNKLGLLRNITAKFSIRQGPGQWEPLGSLEGTAVDRSFQRPGEKRAAWLELLVPPPGYKGNLKIHPAENDPVGGLERALMLLFQKNGKVKTSVSHLASQLSHDKFFYVEDFELVPNFCGMLSNGVGFQGTVTLAPAGIVERTLAMEQADGVTRDSFETVRKLKGVYGKAGFAEWLNGGPRTVDAMHIMGQVIPGPGTDSASDTMRPLESREISGLKLNPPAAEQTSSASTESYSWHGRRYAKTADTDPAWIEEGKPKPRRVRHPSHGLIDPEQEYAIQAIIGENATQYLIRWMPSSTGERYADTWEPKENANARAVAAWNRR